jgi:hypothetical protein
LKYNVKMLSRAKSALESEEKESAPEKKSAPKLDNFIRDRDYMGAITLLEVRRDFFRFTVSQVYGKE